MAPPHAHRTGAGEPNDPGLRQATSRRDSILEAVGNTPMVRLSRLFPATQAEVWAKLEGFNPGGSAKDRAAVGMVEAGLRNGRIGASTLILEASSGNTGVALAQVCALKGLRFRCYVDPNTTRSHVALLRAYGAEVERIDVPDDDGEYHPPKVERIRTLVATGEDVFWPNQHGNAANPESHRTGTMAEILRDLGRAPDLLFVATSTCGTLRGCLDALREVGGRTRVLAVDAVGSRIFSPSTAPRHVPGLGASRPSPLTPSTTEVHVRHVTTADCVAGCRGLVRTEAILAGASSGGVVHAMRQEVPRLGRGEVCVGILPDRGDRYLDTVYDQDWLPGRAGARGAERDLRDGSTGTDE